MGAIAAVVFDIGGVVQDSPLHAIARYEKERGLDANAINRVVVAHPRVWQKPKVPCVARGSME